MKPSPFVINKTVFPVQQKPKPAAQKAIQLTRIGLSNSRSMMLQSFEEMVITANRSPEHDQISVDINESIRKWGMGIGLMDNKLQALRAPTLEESQKLEEFKQIKVSKEKEFINVKEKEWFINEYPELGAVLIIQAAQISGDCVSYVKTRGVQGIDPINRTETVVSNQLRESGYLETLAPVPGDPIIYFAAELAKHIGIFVGDQLVESKLGTNHGVYRHDIGLVPANYGDAIKFYSKQ